LGLLKVLGLLLLGLLNSKPNREHASASVELQKQLLLLCSSHRSKRSWRSNQVSADGKVRIGWWCKGRAARQLRTVAACSVLHDGSRTCCYDGEMARGRGKERLAANRCPCYYRAVAVSHRARHASRSSAARRKAKKTAMVLQNSETGNRGTGCRNLQNVKGRKQKQGNSKANTEAREQNIRGIERYLDWNLQKELAEEICRKKD
jgi:hypothetical protein